MDAWGIECAWDAWPVAPIGKGEGSRNEFRGAEAAGPVPGDCCLVALVLRADGRDFGSRGGRPELPDGVPEPDLAAGFWEAALSICTPNSAAN